MKPRTKKKIAQVLKREENYLNMIVKESVRRDAKDTEHLKNQEDFLKEIREEPCFEDTLVGKIEAEEKRVFDQIVASLDELSLIVGSDYAKRFKLAVNKLRAQEAKDRDTSR